MARPIKNNLEFFRHENGMRNDKKMLAIRNKFDNMTGYGLYNATLELLSEEELLVYPFDNDHLEMLAGDFRVDIEYLKEFFAYAIKIRLFKVVNNLLTCVQLEKRHADVFEKRGRTLDDLRAEAGIDLGVSATETTGEVGFLLQKLDLKCVSATESTHSIEEYRIEEKSIEEHSIAQAQCTWRNSFELYLSMVKDALNKLTADESFISEQERLNPGLDIRLTLEKAVCNFWGKEAGWKHKKKSRAKEIDMEQTLINAISMQANKVYKQKQSINHTVSKHDLNDGIFSLRGQLE
jgi:hypothetical protein